MDIGPVAILFPVYIGKIYYRDISNQYIMAICHNNMYDHIMIYHTYYHSRWPYKRL